MHILSESKLFGGQQLRVQHTSHFCQCSMNVSIYLPEQANSQHRAPVVYWLSGLTCSDENFTVKAGAQRMASELGLILVAPDTSPRGQNVHDSDTWDLGQGAGFYLDATEAPWKSHYQMYSYISKELPKFLYEHFPVDPEKQSIMGHSMGGHGALTIALNNPSQYKSVSAFAPICSPTRCEWGKKAFTHYLGHNTETWNNYDTCYLLQNNNHDLELPILIYQGTKDNFLSEQLKPNLLASVFHGKGETVPIVFHEDYDHSYNFIASFIDEHLKFHHQHLQA